jgi:ribonuclease HII
MKKQTIKEIKEKLALITDEKDPFLLELQADERKGVQAALEKWQKKKKAIEALETRFITMNQYETQGHADGYEAIAGIDEVGRGPLAGPVVAAAVILDTTEPILGLDDSKKLSAIKRNELFQEIQEKAKGIGLGIISAENIDHVNILEATKLAMLKAVSDLSMAPDYLLVDAMTLPTEIPQQAVIKGDMNSNSIAAASIIAKVTRDRLMAEYDKKYPGYEFLSNVGYGTKAHLEGLEEYGATPIHRRTFSPVNKYI